MSAAAGDIRSPGPFFEITVDWLPTAEQLADAGLPGDQLTPVALDLVRISPGGKWHPVPTSRQVPPCARARRAAATGGVLTRRQDRLLATLELCRACTGQVQPPGRIGAYLDLTRQIIAARAWTQALEQAALDADWPTCLRWTARTPFDSENVLALLDALGGDPNWQPAQHAATIAWQELWDRADAAHARARLAAGPPGLRAHAAAACALAAAQPETVWENELIGAISARPRERNGPVPNRCWGTASHAWAEAICLDADPVAARTALAGAVEQLYATAPVRDIALLPPAPACPGGEFSTPAAWAQAEYQALREVVTRRWCQRLETALAEVQAQDDQAAGQWRLLLIAGWPPTAVRDQELAYLAHYPELIRTPHAPEPGTDPACPSRAIAVLHVPGFAARHAAAHHSPHLTATIGPAVAAGTTPTTDQVSALTRYATAIHRGRHLTGAWCLPQARHDSGAENQ